MNRFSFALALAASLAMSASTVAAAPDDAMHVHADGQVTIGDTTYPTMTDWHQSAEFRSSGRRCGSVEPEPVAEAMPSDCSFARTSILPEYEPEVGEFVIPVVFHVIENGSGQGVISDELIQSQLDVLNEDFLALSGTLGEPGTPSAIRFEFAAFDPDGNATTGINRIVSATQFNNPESAKTALRWDTTRYFNIYTNSAGGGGTLGYATFPMQSAGAANDGVVLLWTSVGRNAPQGGNYDLGRTGTHEVGHYLGLFHTFQDGCGTGYTAGDRVADTQSESEPNFGCNAAQSQCGGGLDPIENYMDYSDDRCMNTFTPEQVNRMRCAITNYRTGLFNAVPTVDFSFEAAELEYTFTDLSVDSDGTVDAWEWDFGDGNTSTEQNPSHTFADFGVYEVKLTALDDRGVRASKVETITVNIAPVAGFTYAAEEFSVVFTDTSSDNGTITAWEWDFGDGNTSSEQSPTNIYLAEGSYTVTLTVTDDLETKTTTTEDIVVAENDAGCGCSSSGSGAPLGTIFIFGLAFLAIRRRRKS